MITITKKQDCCGCAACVQRCPKKCISLIEDNEGFLYPKVKIEMCIDCGLCEKVCPVKNQNNPSEPLEVYAAINPNEKIREQSSSGGIFTMLSEKVLNEGGVVFGARFDEKWEVKHDFIETIEDLSLLRGSKYVQSRIEDNYIKVEQFLKKNRKVLFSGTPCQIAGLKRFLRKEYENLISVEILCHGVPSPKVWKLYLKEIAGSNFIESINFRNKDNGWKNYNVVFNLKSFSFYERASKNLFIRGFLSHLYLRPSCEQCPAKQGQSNSDITIGDCWGINIVRPDLDDNKGTSIVLINTPKGKDFLHSITSFSGNLHIVELNNLQKYNGGFNKSMLSHPKRVYFFRKLNQGYPVTTLIKKITVKPLYLRLLYKIKKI